MNTSIEEKEARLRAAIADKGSVAVAFSAGVDSTFLLWTCCEVLGPERVLAITANSATFPPEELDEACKLTAMFGVELAVVETNELDNPDFVCNDTNRCFYCQDNRFRVMWDMVLAREIATLASGVNADDLNEHRPGLQAVQEHRVEMPLVEANLGKADIRALSLRAGLPTHDKPSMACLASRIPYGRQILVENLDQVAQAEDFLKREIGLRQVRVRHYDHVARLEVEAKDILHVVQPGVRERITAELCRLGFVHVTLDLEAFRSGSMNEGLKLL